MPKYCYNCGTQLPENANNCPSCGIKTEVEQTEYSNPEQTNNISPEMMQQYNAYVLQNRTNSLALVGFILSIVFSLFTCGLLSIVGLVLSIVGLTEINKTGEKGKGFAIAGIIISAISIGLIIFFILLASLSTSTELYDSIGRFFL